MEKLVLSSKVGKRSSNPAIVFNKAPVEVVEI